MLGVSRDTPAKNRAFKEKYDFPFALISDIDGEMSVAYGACTSADQKTAKRVSYLIGEDGKVLKAYAKVSPSAHPDEVLADLGLGGPIALGEAKRLVRDIPAMEQEAAFEYASDLSARLFKSDEAAAGMQAFLKREKPPWAPAGD